MKIVPVVFAAAILACGSAAKAECIVAEPSPTPLNVCTAPYGRIIGALANGQPVSLIDASADLQGSPWVYVADEAGNPLGWVYRRFIVCKGERF